jgi:glycosyltransferase involved in cell wall biosynthesis
LDIVYVSVVVYEIHGLIVKIVNISTYDISGGAGRAAYRMHKQFQLQGVDSKMLVLDKTIDDTSVVAINTNKIGKLQSKISHNIDNIPLVFYKKPETTWSTGWFGFNVLHLDLIRQADVIILYWVSGGFLTPKMIKKISLLNKPIIWRLSDMWPFTGGCHYSSTCFKYIDGCGHCPQLKSNSNYDASSWLYNKKNNLWRDVDITIVCPSMWMEECAKNSKIFSNKNVIRIPTGIDVNIFKKIDKKIARHILNLSQDKRLILLGAINIDGDKRKGGIEAYNALKDYIFEYGASNVELVVFGTSNNIFKDLSVDVNIMGRVSDEYTLALLYSASDVFIAPSKEENLANTVLEALSCNTPVVAFNVGGMPDAINHRINGYLAHPYDTKDIAKGIKWCLDLNKKNSLLDKNFFLEAQVSKYINLINALLNKN